MHHEAIIMLICICLVGAVIFIHKAHTSHMWVREFRRLADTMESPDYEGPSINRSSGIYQTLLRNANRRNWEVAIAAILLTLAGALSVLKVVV